MKKALIVFGIILGIGILLVAIGAAVYVSNGKKTGGEFTERVIVEDKEITSFSASIGVDKTVLRSSDDGRLRIECYENERYYYDYSVKNGKAELKSKVKSFFGFGALKQHDLVIYLPSTVTDLKIELASGSLDSEHEALYLNSLKLDIASGSVDFKNASVDGKVKLEVASGGINISDLSARDFEIDVASGKISLARIRADKIDIDLSSGRIGAADIKANGVDAEVSSGTLDISLSEPFADYAVRAKASSGRVTVKNNSETVAEGKSISCGNGSKRVKVEVASGGATIGFVG